MGCKREQKKEQEKRIWELNVKKQELFEKWQQCWVAAEKEENLEFFFKFFPTVYRVTKIKAEHNKRQNEVWKKRFVMVLTGGFFVFFGIFGWQLFVKRESNIFDSGIALLLLILLGTIIAKWIDIKKFQETWIRHSTHLHKMDSEMLKFVSGMEPYNNTNKKKIFAKNIMEIWDGNQEKFASNMENKEKELTDSLQNLKAI